MKEKMKAVKGKSYMEPVMEKYKPSIHFDQSQLPAIKDWVPGKFYKISLRVKQTSMSMNAHNKISASFEIHGAKAEKE